MFTSLMQVDIMLHAMSSICGTGWPYNPRRPGIWSSLFIMALWCT